jgi:hypothetical protein
MTKMGIANDPLAAARFKGHTDIYIHSNGLVWNQFGPLNSIQIGFFAVVYFVAKNPEHRILLLGAMLVAIALQVGLILVVFRAKRERDLHGETLWQDFQFDITGQFQFEGVRYKLNRLFRAGFVAGVFLTWIFADLAAGLYFWLVPVGSS